jgi:hypothetical protein
MHVKLIALCLAIPLAIGAQSISAPSTVRATHTLATLLTVCELLENVDQYDGSVVAVVGRLSSNVFDGVWLSENDCSGKVASSDPHWPYAVFLSCYADERPNPDEDKLDINAEALKAKLDRLRKTTQLEYYTPLFLPRSGETSHQPQAQTQPKKEVWAVAVGRIKPRLAGQKGGYGAVRAKAQLCSRPDSELIEIEEPDSTQPTR